MVAVRRQRQKSSLLRMQGALNTRIVIEQAKGMIAQTYAVDPDQAFAMMRDYCRSNGLRLSDVANRAITARGDLDRLSTSG